MTLVAKYNEEPISSVTVLARKLDVKETLLIDLAINSADFWRPGRTVPKEGKPPRETNDASTPLKSIHERIKERILDKVTFPEYVLGGIASDENTTRSVKTHAEAHIHKYLLLSEDIAGFYPNTTSAIVNSVWRCFFNFPPDVASMLTKLTTYQDQLPQGWITSTHIANLVLWRHEPETVSKLRDFDVSYTRWIDDVTISSCQYIDSSTKTQLVAEIYRMMQRSGYQPNRDKHELTTSGQKMQVVNLNVGGRYASVTKQYRNVTRSIVHKCVTYNPAARNSPEFISLWDKASGRVGHIQMLHPAEAKKLRAQLNNVRPQRAKKKKNRSRKTFKLPTFGSS